MAQHDYVIANGTGAAVRSDLNGSLAAIVSNNSGATEPATMYAYQWWPDTTTGLLKQRNAANSAWITIGTLASANLGLLSLAGGTMTGALAVTAGTAALPGIAVSGDLNTGITSPGADQLAISTGGTSRLAVSTTAVSSTLAVDVPLGAVGTPSLTFTGDLNTGIYSPGADTLALVTAGSNRLHVTSAGPVGINTSTPDAGAKLTVSGGILSTGAFSATTGSTGGFDYSLGNLRLFAVGTSGATKGGFEFIGKGADNSSSTPMTIDSSGRLLVGTSTARGVGASSSNNRIQITDVGGIIGGLSTYYYSADGGTNTWNFCKSRGSSDGSFTIVNSGDSLGTINWIGADGNGFTSTAASISAAVDGTPGANDMPGRLVFSVTPDGAATPAERMRITQAGDVLVGRTDAAAGNLGVKITSTGFLEAVMSNDTPLSVNRKDSDGNLVLFQQQNTTEGTISVSGTTVSYNGAHLSRWSQLPSGAERIEILRGSILSNIDEMCEWGEEDNEQLNRMKVSDVEGDKNVSGVFQAWDDDDDTYTDDFYCAMTGDFIIRIAEGITVERGDLLMSAGDGTAKPQDDDIIRSKTIAKVTSTNVSCTYEDGSYCVPCVLMAC